MQSWDRAERGDDPHGDEDECRPGTCAATASGERLMDIVPANEPTIIEAKVKPTDIDQVKVGQKATFAQLLAIANLRVPAGAKITAKVSTPKVCKVVGKAIKGLKAGTCRGTMTIKPKKGKAQKKAFTFKVTKTGKRLPLALHH
jgi:hypothetical protein